MKRQYYIYILSLIFVSASFSACKSSRKVSKVILEEQDSDFLFSKLKEKELKFKTIEAKFAIEYKENRKFLDFKGQFRIVKDSVIWISFNQDLGIEVARVLITQDSVKFINRLQKEYLITDYNFINSFLNTNVDFGILQSIILGNDFEYYELAEFKASTDNGFYKLSTNKRSKLKKHVRNNADAERVFLQSIWLNPETYKIVHLKLKELTKDSKKLSAEYSHFENYNGQLFPTSVDYLIEAEDAIEVNIKYTRVTLNESFNFPFKIPSKYTPSK